MRKRAVKRPHPPLGGLFPQRVETWDRRVMGSLIGSCDNLGWQGPLKVSTPTSSSKQGHQQVIASLGSSSVLGVAKWFPRKVWRRDGRSN